MLRERTLTEFFEASIHTDQVTEAIRNLKHLLKYKFLRFKKTWFLDYLRPCVHFLKLLMIYFIGILPC